MPRRWRGIVEFFTKYRPKLHVLPVAWKLKQDGWITCNTDGASREDLLWSTYGFCLRDAMGNLIYAEAQNINTTTNMEAEAKAM